MVHEICIKWKINASVLVRVVRVGFKFIERQKFLTPRLKGRDNINENENCGSSNSSVVKNVAARMTASMCCALTSTAESRTPGLLSVIRPPPPAEVLAMPGDELE